jgi:hypothetical protein
VSLRATEELRGGRCTVSARLCGQDGKLVLWAHDGVLPTAGDTPGLALRTVVGEGRPRLAVAHRDGLTWAAARDVVRIEHDEGPMLLVVLRVDRDEAALLALAL